MEYAYAALLLTETGAELNERNLTAVLEASDADVDRSRAEALVAATEGVDLAAVAEGRGAVGEHAEVGALPTDSEAHGMADEPAVTTLDDPPVADDSAPVGEEPSGEEPSGEEVLGEPSGEGTIEAASAEPAGDETALVPDEPDRSAEERPTGEPDAADQQSGQDGEAAAGGAPSREELPEGGAEGTEDDDPAEDREPSDRDDGATPVSEADWVSKWGSAARDIADHETRSGGSDRGGS